MKEFLESGTVGKIELDKSICVHSYAQAKKSPKMKEKLEKYVERWKQLGFIEGFPEERKEELAYAYEQLAQFLIFCAVDQTDALFTDQNKYFDTVGFPMIRRVMGNLEPNEFDFQKFIKYCKEFNVNDIINEVEELNPIIQPWEPGRGIVRKYFSMDAEAEAVALCCEMIEEKYKNPDKDSKTIREKHFERVKKLIEKKKEELKNEGTSSDNTNE